MLQRGRPSWGASGSRSSRVEAEISSVRVVLGAVVVLAALAAANNVSAAMLDYHSGILAAVGASAMLMLAAPHSPFASARAVIFGNVIAAIFGLAAASLMPWPFVAAGSALGATALVATRFDFFHPPSGGIALLAALGGPHDLRGAALFIGVGALVQSVLVVATVLGCYRVAGALSWISQKKHNERARRVGERWRGQVGQDHAEVDGE